MSNKTLFGPVACTVRDTALLLQVIVGKDGHDNTSAIPNIPNYVQACDSSALVGVRLGILRNVFQGWPGAPWVLEMATVDAAIAELRDTGDVVVDANFTSGLEFAKTEAFNFCVHVDTFTNIP